MRDVVFQHWEPTIAHAIIKKKSGEVVPFNQGAFYLQGVTLRK